MMRRELKYQRVRAQTSRAATGLQPEIGLDHNAWRQLKRKFKAHCHSRNLPCWLCREYINYNLTSGRWAFEADHYHPRKTHPHLVLSWANLRPSHVKCNRARQAKVVVSQQDWVQPSW